MLQQPFAWSVAGERRYLRLNARMRKQLVRECGGILGAVVEDSNNLLTGACNDLLESPLGQFVHVICWHSSTPLQMEVHGPPPSWRDSLWSMSLRGEVRGASKTQSARSCPGRSVLVRHPQTCRSRNSGRDSQSNQGTCSGQAVGPPRWRRPFWPVHHSHPEAV